MRFGFSILLASLALNLFAAELSDNQQIEERIKPLGQVRLAEQTIAADKAATETTPPQEVAGKATYDQHCSACHSDGLAGAPKFRDAKGWQTRTSNRTIEDLFNSANKGLNAMPSKGTCSTCSDEDLKNAIQYMLPQP